MDPFTAALLAEAACGALIALLCWFEK